MQQQLLCLLEKAFYQAKHNALADINHQSDVSLQNLHASRSRHWITALANELLQHTQSADVQNEYIAFHKNNTIDRQIFGLNEFLFDIVIGKMINLQTASGYRHTKAKDDYLKAIQSAVWVVESEFQFKNSRSLLLDLNKLAISKAKNKLFIISLDEKSRIKDWTRETIKKLMCEDDANIYLACVPHPKDWLTDGKPEVEQIFKSISESS